MTSLLVGSLLLIGAAAVALLLGWASTDEPLLWASIVASAASALLLALAYWRARFEDDRER